MEFFSENNTFLWTESAGAIFSQNLSPLKGLKSILNPSKVLVGWHADLKGAKIEETIYTSDI